MAIKRPKNINKRLTGTPSCTTGNAGQIGPVKTPYLKGNIFLGCECYGGGNTGVFRITESNCGVERNCNCPPANSGGRIICASSNVYWIVAPNTAEVSRNWYSRDDADTRAQQVSGCTGWFVPASGQLQNPGFTCRTYWDSFSSAGYWSSSSYNVLRGFVVSMTTGSAYGNDCPANKTCTRCVRAFRCVTY